MSRWFSSVSQRAAALTGHYITFVAAFGLVLLWAISGPFLEFSEVWQLTINTGTTIITFLMVFLVQNTQNRDSKAIHVKLDEIIASLQETNDDVLDAEDETEEDLKVDLARYAELRTSGGETTQHVIP